jgi:iron(III) transport system substrate-binding protein
VFARKAVAIFEAQTGIHVQAKYDTEAGKTTSLVNLIQAERNRPRADVFWSSELFNTIKMAQDGLLAEYRPSVADIPDRYKDPGGKWTAFALRARVLSYNTQNVKAEDVPKTWRTITDSRWKGKLGLADPRFGTTRGHFAAMYAAWGEPEYIKFITELRTTLDGRLLDGNATSALLVGRGELSIGATDTDDVYARQLRREPIGLSFADMGDGGTLLIPNSVALLVGAPHPNAAKVLIDYLTSDQTEKLLAQSESHNIPVRENLRKELGIDLPPESKLDFNKITASMERAIALAGEHLIK